MIRRNLYDTSDNVNIWLSFLRLWEIRTFSKVCVLDGHLLDTKLGAKIQHEICRFWTIFGQLSTKSPKQFGVLLSSPQISPKSKGFLRTKFFFRWSILIQKDFSLKPLAERDIIKALKKLGPGIEKIRLF